jgi:tRNA pseudouridine38-40 synthase
LRPDSQSPARHPGARTLALWLDYDGTDFHGWGLQPRARTVQGVLETALASVLNEPVRVTAAARTDTGVHAGGQVVSFRTASRLATDAVLRACNARLPDDVLVTAAREQPPGFDARRAARRRSYRYSVWNAPLPCLWRRRYLHHVADPLDVAEMDRASQRLVGTLDYRAFASELGPRERARGTTRTVTRAGWEAAGALLTFDITASGFLRHMVRGVVGTLLRVGRRRLGVLEFDAILRGRDRRLAGPTAPAAGLALVGVDYD